MATAIFDKVNQMMQEIEQANPEGAVAVEQFRIRYLGTKNIIKPLFSEIRNIPNERKKESTIPPALKARSGTKS